MQQQSAASERRPAPSLMLNMRSVHLTDAQFYRLCADNPELRLELSKEGRLTIISPTGSETGRRNSRIIQRLANWAEKGGSGICFDSSAGFTLPNGAKRSPDAAWVRRDVWESLTEEQRSQYAPLSPDFVIELRSPSDNLADLKAKMVEYIETGSALGWLFDPSTRSVHIYRAAQDPECIQNPSPISGDPVLPGFVFDPSEIW
jgi:Uma2 family endonuclease